MREKLQPMCCRPSWSGYVTRERGTQRGWKLRGIESSIIRYRGGRGCENWRNGGVKSMVALRKTSGSTMLEYVKRLM